jgi:hypothetical protein
MDQPQKTSSLLKTIWEGVFFTLTFSSWGQFQAGVMLLVLILAGTAWHEYVGPVSYFFLLLIVLLLGALVAGAIAYFWRRQKGTGSQSGGATSPRSR